MQPLTRNAAIVARAYQAFNEADMKTLAERLGDRQRGAAAGLLSAWALVYYGSVAAIRSPEWELWALAAMILPPASGINRPVGSTRGASQLLGRLVVYRR